jgi:hydantoinase/carbamoylase family amidase
MTSSSPLLFGEPILRQAEHLAQYTEVQGAGRPVLTRTYLTPQHRAAGDYLLALMRDAGMQADYDCLGNVVGRYAAAEPGAPFILTGSHMDSVRDAGKYDGLFGILSPIAAVQALHRQGRRLAHGIEIVAFGDEEGVRFGVTLIGSRALAGKFDFGWLDGARDVHGTTLRQALAGFGFWDGSEAAIRALARDPARYACFVESHIEQGPVLLDEGLALGVVSAIVGATRVAAVVRGVAGHAGTVPMDQRRDALAAACEMALAAERLARADAQRLVATVGKFEVGAPGGGGGAINVIPGEVHFSIDLRSGDDALREQALSALAAECRAIAARRGVALDWHPFYTLPAAPCDARLQRQLSAALERQGHAPRVLPSGAGHDAMAFAGVLPQAMLFLRCGAGGISHNPAETITADDAEAATAALLDFFEQFEAPA